MGGGGRGEQEGVLGKVTYFYKESKSNIKEKKLGCVCIPILVTTFPEWLSGTEPLPHTPGAVRPSSLC